MLPDFAGLDQGLWLPFPRRVAKREDGQSWSKDPRFPEISATIQVYALLEDEHVQVSVVSWRIQIRSLHCPRVSRHIHRPDLTSFRGGLQSRQTIERLVMFTIQSHRLVVLIPLPLRMSTERFNGVSGSRAVWASNILIDKL